MLNENSVECSTGFPYDEIDAKENPRAPRHTLEEKSYSLADMMEYTRRVVSFIRGKDRCRVTVDCMYLALGDADLEEITMTSVGESHGLTKAAISKRTREVREQLHLGMNQNNKSARATSRYTVTNRSPVRLGPTTT